MNRKVVLFVSHNKIQCGVYQYGKNIYNVIKDSTKFNFEWVEIDSLADLQSSVQKYNPDIIIYNYHPSTMPWLTGKVAPRVYKSNISSFKGIQVGIIHEITQEIADGAINYRNKYLFGKSNSLINKLFDFYIAADPTLLLKNPSVFKTGRLISSFVNEFTPPKLPTIGSYGFGTANKGFEKIITKVQHEFDEAVIRFNIPYAAFGDYDGENALRIAQNCRSLVTKPGIKLEISHDFLEPKELLDFLAKNSINVFLYEDKAGRGLSSAIDNALAVKRPICVSESTMFRHVLKVLPNISSQKSTLYELINNGFTAFQPMLTDWDDKTILWEYDRIISACLFRFCNPQKIKLGIINSVLSFFRRLLSMPDKTFTWLRNTHSVTDDDMIQDSKISFNKVNDSSKLRFNRILDNQARDIYADVINQLNSIFPITMSKKISEANVQQAFVLDTVYRNLINYNKPKILCVGSYEDTASMYLRKMGLNVEEIDPMINYYLQEFIDKPSTVANSYDIIFSTSVIEHDPDDETFVKCINNLMSPGGIAVITCDFKDDWRQGDLKPEVDARLYTQKDLKERLILQMPECDFVDTPDWNCPNPDFLFLGKYQYAFASFVVKKKK